MTFTDTLAQYRTFAAQHALPWITPSALANRVDHKAFNYSLEEPILREFGSYLDIKHEYTFSTCQPCIRGTDLGQIKKCKTRNHLALFHIFPTAFFLSPDPAKLSQNQQAGIKATFEFLQLVGLDISRLKITYFGGGRLDEISDGQVPVKKVFPPDEVTLATCLDFGLAPDQLHPVSNLDTFVATFAGDEDFFAGHRYEVYHPLPDGTPLEIATGEALAHRQLRVDGVTVDILPASCSAAPIVIGLERLHAIMERKADVRSISCLKDLAAGLEPLAPKLSADQTLEAADFLRAAHLVVAQTHSLKLTKHLAEQRRVIVSHLCKLLGNQASSYDALKNALAVNAAIHPWLPELTSELDSVANTLMQNISRRIAKA